MTLRRLPRLAAPLDPPGAGLLAALLAALLIPPLVPFELAWEVAASLGYGACAALLLTFHIAPVLPGMMTSWRFTLHRVAGDAVLALVAGHVGIMLALDPFVLDYLGWLMPVHVLLGLLASIGLVLAVTTREPALPAWLRRGGRRLHAWVGIVALALTAAHVLASATKPIGIWRLVLLGAALLVVALRPLRRLALGAAPVPGDRRHAGDVRDAVAGLLALVGLIVALLVAAPQLLVLLRG